ncbi:hypothetical protein WA026_023063 [Henosepilachna vigintioctopunctata]|uniref:Uncharacterized protein n=1 Tax=Henosepilachna vigintioctopunctata TaxID=420089 RepID=A0AAW1UXF8_9CUCU
MEIKSVSIKKHKQDTSGNDDNFPIREYSTFQVQYRYRCPCPLSQKASLETKALDFDKTLHMVSCSWYSRTGSKLIHNPGSFQQCLVRAVQVAEKTGHLKTVNSKITGSDRDNESSDHISYVESELSNTLPGQSDSETSPITEKHLQKDISVGDFAIVRYDNIPYPGLVKEVGNKAASITSVKKCGGRGRFDLVKIASH